MCLINYVDKNLEKVDKILDYLIGLGGFEQLFEQIDDNTFTEIQEKLYTILANQLDPRD